MSIEDEAREAAERVGYSKKYHPDERDAYIEGYLAAGFTRHPQITNERFVTDADLDRFEATADPIYRSTITAAKASKFLVSDLGQWIVRLVAEVRRLRHPRITAEMVDRAAEAMGHQDYLQEQARAVLEAALGEKNEGNGHA